MIRKDSLANCFRGFKGIERLALAAIVTAFTFGSALGAETWQPTSIREDFLQVIVETGDTLLGGSAIDGVQASYDGGRTWSRIDACFGGSFNSVSALHASEGLIVASFEGAGICRSRDGGTTWEEANQGLPRQPYIEDLIRSGDTLLAGGWSTTGGDAVYRAAASGGPWRGSAAGLDSGVMKVERFAMDPAGTLFAGISQIRAASARFLYSSRDNGVTWDTVPLRLSAPVHDLLWTEGHLIAATARGVFRSSDGGAAWEDCGPEFTSGAAYALAAHGGIVYAGSSNVVFRSRDGGGSWLALHTGLPGIESAVSSLWAGPTAILAGMGPRYGVWRLESSVQLIPRSPSVTPPFRLILPDRDALGRIWGR